MKKETNNESFLKSLTSYAKKNTKKVKLTLMLLGVIISVILLAGLIDSINTKTSSLVSEEYILATLSKSSELTTVKINFTGMAEYEDSGIPIINKSDFIMVYHATARVGINLEDIEVTTNKNKKIIYIELPESEVQDVHIDASSIRYFDEHFSLFNVNEKEDSNTAIKLAEEHARIELAQMGVIEQSNEQAEALIKGILIDTIPEGYTIQFVD